MDIRPTTFPGCSAVLAAVSPYAGDKRCRPVQGRQSCPQRRLRVDLSPNPFRGARMPRPRHTCIFFARKCQIRILGGESRG